jgi:predicted MFS family arabinose efflux permease
VVFCAALGGFVDLYVTQAIFPDLHARFGVTVAGAGALVTITTLTLAFCAPFASIVAGAIGARRATLIGLAGLTVCAALMAFVSGTGLLVALRAAQGLFIPAVLASVLASNQVADDASDAHALSGTYVSGTILGGILGRLLPATLLPVAGWEIAFIVFSVLHLVLFLVVALLSPTPSPTLAPVGTVSGFATWLKELRSMPRQRAAGLGLAGFSLLFAQAATFTYITIRLSAGPFGWGTGALGLVYLVFLPSLVFLKTSRGLVVRLGPLPAFKRAAGVVWLGLLLTLVSSAVVLVLGLVLVAVGVFLCQAILAQQVSEASAADGPHVPGIYLCCYYLGSSAGAVAPGLLWSELGWPGCIALIAIVQFCAVAGTWWLHRAPAPLTSPAPSAEPQAVANPSLTESDPARPGFVSNESEGLPG